MIFMKFELELFQTSTIKGYQFRLLTRTGSALKKFKTAKMNHKLSKMVKKINFWILDMVPIGVGHKYLRGLLLTPKDRFLASSRLLKMFYKGYFLT